MLQTVSRKVSFHYSYEGAYEGKTIQMYKVPNPNPNLSQIQISTRSKSQPDHNRNQIATKTNQTQLLSWATKPNFIKVNLREESINEHNLLYLVREAFK